MTRTHLVNFRPYLAGERLARQRELLSDDKSPVSFGRFSSASVIDTLRARDGGFCFYCGAEVPEGSESLEHLLARAHSGPDNFANFALSCLGCNGEAGALSIVQKVQFRDRLRGVRVKNEPFPIASFLAGLAAISTLTVLVVL